MVRADAGEDVEILGPLGRAPGAVDVLVLEQEGDAALDRRDDDVGDRLGRLGMQVGLRSVPCVSSCVGGPRLVLRRRERVWGSPAAMAVPARQARQGNHEDPTRSMTEKCEQLVVEFLVFDDIGQNWNTHANRSRLSGQDFLSFLQPIEDFGLAADGLAGFNRESWGTCRPRPAWAR